MSTAITHLAAQERVNDLNRDAHRPGRLQARDLRREAESRRDDVKLRRVAVIRPAGAHFALVPSR